MPVRLGPRVLAMTSRHRGLFQKASYLKKHSPGVRACGEKFVAARRRNQHARRVRYPESPNCICRRMRRLRYDCADASTAIFSAVFQFRQVPRVPRCLSITDSVSFDVPMPSG